MQLCYQQGRPASGSYGSRKTMHPAGRHCNCSSHTTEVLYRTITATSCQDYLRPRVPLLFSSPLISFVHPPSGLLTLTKSRYPGPHRVRVAPYRDATVSSPHCPVHHHRCTHISSSQLPATNFQVPGPGPKAHPPILPFLPSSSVPNRPTPSQCEL